MGIQLINITITKRGSKDNPSYGIMIPKHHFLEGRLDPNKLVNCHIEQKAGDEE